MLKSDKKTDTNMVGKFLSIGLGKKLLTICFFSVLLIILSIYLTINIEIIFIDKEIQFIGKASLRQWYTIFKRKSNLCKISIN